MTTVLRGDRVLVERRRLDLKQETLAAKISVDRSYISQIERNVDVNVGIKTVFALAEALGVSPQYLLGLTDDPLQGIPDEDEEPKPAVAAWPAWLAGLGRELWEVFAGLGAEDQMMLIALARRLKAAQTPRIIGGEEEGKG